VNRFQCPECGLVVMLHGATQEERVFGVLRICGVCMTERRFVFVIES